MDVKCERCGAEYEFDESLLGDKGTTVKCSSCGFVFRVMPRRDAGRAALKLRYVRTGQVELIGSLRDLQSKIHAGQVTVDDQLGREGFPYRRLGDVPELKNFFAQRASASSSMGEGAGTPNHNQLRVSHTSMPPPDDQPPARRPQGGRTVLGVGPTNLQNPGQFPAPPRVPNIAGQAPAPSAPREPAGQRFGSDAPTASRTRPDAASISQAPTVPGVSPAEMRNSFPANGQLPRPGQAPVPSNPVRGLYLAEDEAPPARATAGSSKIWVYAIVLVLLGGGGWLAMSALGKKSPEVPPVDPAASRVEVPTPSPVVTPTPEVPAQPAAPTPPSAPQTPAPTAQVPAEKPAAPVPAPKETAPAKDSGDKSSDSAGASKDGKEPKDYGGWVAKGDQAFQRGDLPAARKAYESALAQRATGSEANTGLGFTLLGEGRASDAIPYFDRAASSGYADAHIGLGDSYRRLGQKGEAIEAYKDYLERLPGGPKASYVKRQLETLGASVGGAKPAPAEEEPSAPPSGDYRPAGESEAPAEAPTGEGTP